jgi:ABC-type phosphate/phosphonate transport system substrate-binding protein
MLREKGIDPDTTLAGQSFHDSYDAVASALLGKQADVGAMYCVIDGERRIVRDAWGGSPDLVALAIGVEPIPGDTIAAAVGLADDRIREGVSAFLSLAGGDAGKRLLRAVFGTHRFVAGNPSRYEGLEAALAVDTRRE